MPPSHLSAPAILRRLHLTHLRRLHSGPDTIDELLDRHVIKTPQPTDEPADPRRLTTVRREALSLYRDVLRASRFFTWPDSHGVPWRDVLRQNARKEFEDARFETDAEVINRLLIGGHDAVQAALEKVADGCRKQAEDDDRKRTSGR